MSRNIRGKTPTVAQKKLLNKAGKNPKECLYVKEYRSPIDGEISYVFVDRNNGRQFRINVAADLVNMNGGDND